MGESHTILKIIVFLGIVFLLIGAIAPGGNSAWNTFSNSIQGFPSFNNPFGPKTFTFAAAADYHPNSVSTTPLNVRGYQATVAGKCFAKEYPVANSWYDCLNSPDANATYETTGFGGFSTGIAVNLTGFPDPSSSWLALTVTVTFQCKSHGSGVTFEFYDGSTTFLTLGDQDSKTSCHVIGTIPNDDSNQQAGYSNATLTTDVTYSNIHPTNGVKGIGASRFILRNGGAIGSDDLLFFSYATIIVTYQRSSGCIFQDAGNPWDNIVRATYYIGCVIGAVGQFFADGFTFILNGIIFIGQVIFYFINLITSFIGAISYLATFPGAPDIVRNIIAVIVLGFIAFIAIVMLGKVRGTGNVG